ncbi:MAG: ABC transporter ATP-binding protein [bacterium]
MKIVETKSLTKYYLNNSVKALVNLNLEINEGEVFGYIGPNGAGKSTTIRLLLDLIRPTSGTGQIFGLDINKKTVAIKKEIGYLPGEIYLPENLTGQECINYFKKFKKSIDPKYLDKLIERFELTLDKKINEYSKGNKQKLAIILAMMHKPRLLILDEPTSGLDPLNQQTFYDLILETKKWGTTTFLSTHILNEAEKICDRVGILRSGKLIKVENIDSFREKNIRELIIETTETIPLSLLQQPNIKKIERTTSGYRLTTTGKNGAFLQSLSNHQIDDIKIAEPSLEDIFMHYYSKKDISND